MSLVAVPENLSFRHVIDGQGQRLEIPMRMKWRSVAVAFLVAAFLAYFQIHQLENFRLGWELLTIAIAILPLALLLFDSILSRFGKEIVEVKNGFLILRWHLGIPLRRRRFGVSEIRGLTNVEDKFSNPGPSYNDVVSMIRDFGKRGKIKFDVGDRSYYLGASLDDDDVDSVIAWLATALPKTATDYS